MLIDIFIVIGASIVAMVASFFPESDGVSLEALEAIESLAASIYVFNDIIAVDVLWDMVVLIFQIEIVIVTLHILRWMVRQTPMVGDKV
jgi:hypothetical protein